MKEFCTETIELKYKQGEQFEYSNVGAGLLGFILADMDSTTYEQLLQRSIFEKYQMNSSTTDQQKVVDMLVPGLNAKGEEVTNWELNSLVGAGGILSSTQDLSNFLLAQFNPLDEVLELTRISTFNDYKTNIGLGWIIRTTGAGEKRFWHNGGMAGYTSVMQFDVESRNGVIILSNVSGISRKRVNMENMCDRLQATLKLPLK